MTKLLEKNHIDLPYFARGWERKQGSGKPEHALSALVKPILMSLFMIYLLIYQNMKPPSLRWKKPQSVHQIFLPKLVIFC